MPQEATIIMANHSIIVIILLHPMPQGNLLLSVCANPAIATTD
jgi:hypothetical protein